MREHRNSSSTFSCYALLARCLCHGVELAFSLSAAFGAYPRSTTTWRILGSSSKAFAMQRSASCEDGTSVSSKAYWQSVWIP